MTAVFDADCLGGTLESAFSAKHKGGALLRNLLGGGSHGMIRALTESLS